MVSIVIDNLINKDIPVYCIDPIDMGPLTAYIYLSPKGNVGADFERARDTYDEIKKASGNLMFTIPPDARGSVLIEFLTKNKDLFERIHQGHFKGDSVSKLLSQAQGHTRMVYLGLIKSANEVFSQPSSRYSVKRTKSWLFSTRTLDNVWPSGLSIDEACRMALSQASSEGVVLYGDIKKVILEECLLRYKNGTKALTYEQLQSLIRLNIVSKCGSAKA